MEQGLAHQAVYGSGMTQTITHHYGGTSKPKKPSKSKKKNCKK